MTYIYKALVLTVGLLSASLVNASTAAISLTNDTIKGDINLSLGSFGVNAGIVTDKDENSSTAHIGLSVEDSEGGSGPLQIGIGIRLYAIDTNLESDNEDEVSLAIGLGGWYRYTLQDANRVSIYASGYYSPEVLALTNLDHMYNYEIRMEYMTMQNARAYLQYGNVVTVYEDGSRKEFNKGLSIGTTVDF